MIAEETQNSFPYLFRSHYRTTNKRDMVDAVIGILIFFGDNDARTLTPVLIAWRSP